MLSRAGRSPRIRGPIEKPPRHALRKKEAQHQLTHSRSQSHRRFSIFKFLRNARKATSLFSPLEIRIPYQSPKSPSQILQKSREFAQSAPNPSAGIVLRWRPRHGADAKSQPEFVGGAGAASVPHAAARASGAAVGGSGVTQFRAPQRRRRRKRRWRE